MTVAVTISVKCHVIDGLGRIVRVQLFLWLFFIDEEGGGGSALVVTSGPGCPSVAPGRRSWIFFVFSDSDDR